LNHQKQTKMKTYRNHAYTRTVEVIKTTKKCLEYGWSCNVKVTTVMNDLFNRRNGKTLTIEERYWCGDDYLDYKTGHKYYTKNIGEQ